MLLETAALISVGSWLGNKLLDKGFDSVYDQVTSKSFNEKFYLKVNAAALKLKEIHPDVLGGNIEYFFKHEDVLNELFKLLFIDSKISLNVIEKKFDISTLPDSFILEFIELLRIELHKDEVFSQLLSNKEIYLTTLGINNKIEEIMNVSFMSRNEINEIKIILESKFQTKFLLTGFKNKYKKCLINNYAQINFIGLGLDLSIKKGKRKKLEDLFVQPTFSVDELNKEIIKEKKPDFELDHVLNLSEIFNFDKNLIVLGNPGSGKSILTKFISLKIIKKDKSTFENDSLIKRIPFRIELRKYHAFKKEYRQGLVKYMRFLLESEYGFTNILSEDIEGVLVTKETLVIFDGLDEIFDLSDKILIKNDIENFIEVYKHSKVIITSRIIGYDDAPLRESVVLKLKINNFNDEQIEEYIRNWYSIEEEDIQTREKEIIDLLVKKELIDNELISNPLLLSLIVILYRNNLKVPESKLEIYQSCTKTLVDKWDHSKGMDINLPIEIYKRKDTVFADLAYWQYRELSKKDGKVTYQRAKYTVANSLSDKLKIADDFTSDLYSEQFLSYAQNRSLYFDNNFTHKTFLEYFTAFWIFSNIEKKHKKDARNDLIKEYIISPYWHIVLELLLNLIDKDQADNEIIDELITFQLEANENSSIFFLQIFNTIQNVSISSYSSIVRVSIINLLLDYKESEKQKIRKKSNSPFLLLQEQIGIKKLREVINREVINILKENNEIDNTLLLTFYLELIHDFVRRNENKDIFRKVFEEFPKQCIIDTPLNYVMSEFTFRMIEYDRHPLIFTKEFLDNFTVVSFLENIKSKFSNFHYFPIQYICLRVIIFSADSTLINDYLKLINEYDITSDLMIKQIIAQPLFYEKKDDFENMMRNFNSLIDKKHMILLIPYFYQLRFSNFYRDNNDYSPNLKEIIMLLESKEYLKHLKFIVNDKNRETKVVEYIKKYFQIDIVDIKTGGR